ncbi:MAG TPA: fumarylacetoacetate hydrolase family protein, partial [candidate division Zixibacteria bacterium]|nr:fumarylacetoacetate hydrolase family protein [candidate division Zixibacteria bacterium]
MKLISYRNSQKKERLGIVVEDQVADLELNAKALGMTLPSKMTDFLKGGDWFMDQAKGVERALLDGATSQWTPWTSLEHLAPVPNPPSCRDAYAFRQHVATARRNRGVEMIPEFDQFPVFYFTNHLGIIGPGELVVESDHLHALDFELECAIVIGRKGKNIPSSEAD